MPSLFGTSVPSVGISATVKVRLSPSGSKSLVVTDPVRILPSTTMNWSSLAIGASLPILSWKTWIETNAVSHNDIGSPSSHTT